MYPLKFQPIFQERIWGGTRLKSVLAKALPENLSAKPVGEAWELADLPAGTVKADSAGAAVDGSLSSVITNGPWKNKTLHQVLASENGTQGEGAQAIMGKANLQHGRFPLLIKFLDAQSDLSVQVHPDEDYCAKNPGSHLKSEAWYILHAEPGAKIYKGLHPGVTKETFRNALQSNEGPGVETLLKSYKVKAGDCHYLKSGTVHALGAGILAAEVQTPSDTTFRVFDWHRLGPDGKSRQLHIQEALATIQFDAPPTHPEERDGGIRSHVASVFTTVSRLVTCEYFTLERVRMAAEFEQEIPYAEPVVWIVLEGQGVLNVAHPGIGPTAFTKGDTLLLPANMKAPKVKTITDCTWLEAKLPMVAL